VGGRITAFQEPVPYSIVFRDVDAIWGQSRQVSFAVRLSVDQHPTPKGLSVVAPAASIWRDPPCVPSTSTTLASFVAHIVPVKALSWIFIKKIQKRLYQPMLSGAVICGVVSLIIPVLFYFLVVDVSLVL
jgi:hypothetical protein